MRAAVVCCGNVLMGDDGIGIAVADALSTRLPEGVGFFVAEGDPFVLTDIIEGHELVFVVDAVHAKGVREGDVFASPIAVESELPFDAHSVGIRDALSMVGPSVMERRRVVLVGIPVSDVAPRVGLSERIAELRDVIVADVGDAIVNYLNGAYLEARMELEEFILLLHGTVFAFEQASQKLTGSAAGPLITISKSLPVFNELYLKYGINLDGKDIDDQISKFSSFFNSNKDVFDKVTFKQSGNVLSFEIKECFLAKTGIHDVLKGKEGICPMALVVAAGLSKFRHCSLQPSTYTQDGTTTNIVFLDS